LRAGGIRVFRGIMNKLFLGNLGTARTGIAIVQYLARALLSMSAQNVYDLTNILESHLLVIPKMRHAENKVVTDGYTPFTVVGKDLEKKNFSKPLNTGCTRFVGGKLLEVLSNSVTVRTMWHKQFPELIALGSGSIGLPTESQFYLEVVASFGLPHDKVYVRGLPTECIDKLIATWIFWKKDGLRIAVAGDRMLLVSHATQAFFDY